MKTIVKQFIFLFVVSIFLIPNSLNAKNPFKSLLKTKTTQPSNESVPVFNLNLEELSSNEKPSTSSEYAALRKELTKIEVNLTDSQREDLIQALEKNEEINKRLPLLLKTILLGNIANSVIVLFLILKNLNLV